MPHRNEQPTLFELTTCDELDSPPGLPPGHASPSPLFLLAHQRLATDHSPLLLCDQDCGDSGFRSYLYEAAEEGRLKVAGGAGGTRPRELTKLTASPQAGARTG
jgi:hypothetical protein